MPSSLPGTGDLLRNFQSEGKKTNWDFDKTRFSDEFFIFREAISILQNKSWTTYDAPRVVLQSTTLIFYRKTKHFVSRSVYFRLLCVRKVEMYLVFLSHQSCATLHLKNDQKQFQFTPLSPHILHLHLQWQTPAWENPNVLYLRCWHWLLALLGSHEHAFTFSLVFGRFFCYILEAFLQITSSNQVLFTNIYFCIQDIFYIILTSHFLYFPDMLGQSSISALIWIHYKLCLWSKRKEYIYKWQVFTKLVIGSHGVHSPSMFWVKF